MFGLEFLFSAALFALPLVGLPVLLHLLFRRKSPIIPFSTLRFIKSSLQQTAARKKVQRWLLLACRMLLLLLLIWAVAQPVRMLASNFFTSGPSLIAAIVVDTSYSMDLRDQQISRLDQANSIIEGLLRDQLRDARVAIFRSLPAPKDAPEHVEPAAAIQSQWSPLKPQPNPQPLIDRITAALDLLSRQDASDKWLIVLTDLQSKEFPRPITEWKDGRVIFFDLHPEQVRSAAITKVAIDPAQPLPGLKSEAAVEVTGRNSDSRAVTVNLTTPDEKSLDQGAPQMAHLDGTGRAQVRLPVEIPPQQRWMLLNAALPPDDAFPWASSRSQLIEVPPRQLVTLLENQTRPDAWRFTRLALDPTEGKQPAWPLDLHIAKDLTGHENVVVALLTDWPDANRTKKLRDFTRGGGTLLLFLQPGLDELWGKLPDAQKQALLELLPSAPAAAPDSSAAYHALLASSTDPVTLPLGGKEYRWDSLIVRRLLSFTPQSQSVTTLLAVTPLNPPPGAATRTPGLLFRKPLGAGTVFTLATLPDLGLATPPPFLPLMVNLCLRPAAQSEAQNVELGQSLILAGPRFASIDQLEIEGPQRDIYVVKPTTDPAGRRFTFDRAAAPGLYTWRLPKSPTALALTNVQLPASEADLTYRDARSVILDAPGVLVVRSLADLQSRLAEITQPEPHYLGPLSIVLFLLCLEALLGSLSQLWKPIALRSFLPRVPA